MSLNLTLPPSLGTVARAVAEAVGYVPTPTAQVAPANQVTSLSEKDPAAWAAGYDAGILAERRKWESAGAVKGNDNTSAQAGAISWDEVVAETNAQAGLNARSEG
ncbi:hypothetical protein ASG60_20735 [Methylobacterium sp. Leaf469]|uniref:hypothetical protein n=1 Tax=Methylobacterium sp. Leaf469 TaxID=1736387 RepID=UPI0006F3B326|nr:hypothetical protein [Methylobacterium sp. Leaf469]KQT96063.1 hypothetical protein ASG60_20735 [Methylobacterium sp. Leaf469]